MNATRPLPRRLDATDDDLIRASVAAQAIAAAASGGDPGPVAIAESMSHYVYVAESVVVKLVDAGGHRRLDLEIALAPQLPRGLGAPLLSSGQITVGTCEVRYACFTRMPGTRPAIGLPGVNGATARRWAEQAVRRLDDLHNWAPGGAARQALRRSPVHEGFTGRAALIAQIERLRAADRDDVIPKAWLARLMTLAENAPAYAGSDVPVHADCDWSNWLADENHVTALLDFERARFGAPADDWVLLAVTSGAYLGLVLDAVAAQTGAPLELLRNECETRDAAHIADDLYRALALPLRPSWMAGRIRDLEGLVIGQRWRRPTAA